MAAEPRADVGHPDLDGIPFLVAGDVEVNTRRPLCAQRNSSGIFPHVLHVSVDGSTISGSVLDDSNQERDAFVSP
jgi:hypothetical protein